MFTLGRNGMRARTITSNICRSLQSRMSSSIPITSTIGDSGLARKSCESCDKMEHIPAFAYSRELIEVTKSPDPSWKYGQGVRVGATETIQKHKEIDPYALDRPKADNYSLLISGVAPRPIGFISTISGDGNTKNLAPFSYFQVVDHDPPIFIVGIGPRVGHRKDTLRNLRENGECVINSVSENMIESVNATSLDAPYGVSEWDLSGLHEAKSTTVKPSRVQESVFSIEGKVIDIKEFSEYAKPGMASNSVVFIKATRFWIREDAADKDYRHISLDKLRPLGQLGGMSYGRITSTFDVHRKTWKDESSESGFLRDCSNGSKAEP